MRWTPLRSDATARTAEVDAPAEYLVSATLALWRLHARRGSPRHPMDQHIGREALIPNPGLEAFTSLIGTWATVGHHPMVPGTTFHGRTSFDWHEGGAFVVMRSEIDEPEIPSGIAIFGNDDEAKTLSMLYFDERKVARRYEARWESRVLRWWRTTPQFSQRFTITIADDAHTMRGAGEMSRDGGPWSGDLELNYTRTAALDDTQSATSAPFAQDDLTDMASRPATG